MADERFLSDNGPFETISFTIASGQSLSDVKDLGGCIPVSIEMPGTWTAAALTFKGSHQNAASVGKLSVMRSGTVGELNATVAASDVISLDPLDFVGVKWLQLRSGTAASAVNQAGDRIIKLTVKRL